MTIFNRIESVILTNFKPILISIVTVIVTAPIAWYVPKFLEKQEIVTIRSNNQGQTTVSLE